MRKPLKVLHVIQKMYSGGVEQRRLLLAESLDSTEFQQKIICSEADPNFRKKFEKVGCEVFEVGYLKHPLDFKVYAKCLRIIRNYRPDIIHGGVFEGNSIAAIDGFLAQVPRRFIEETSYPLERKKRAHQLMKVLSNLSHKLICISPEVAQILQSKAKISIEKTHVINNAVRRPQTLGQFQKIALRKKYNIKPNEILIGSVGRMQNHIKGFDKLLNLFSELHQRQPAYKLLIIGDGPLLSEYQAQAMELGISEAVIFAGYHAEVNDFYEIMDVYISLPRSEGFGLSVVEAMSHAVPVLASEVGGIKNILRTGENGFLLKEEHLEEVESILNQLMEDKALKAHITKNALQSFEQQYAPEIYTQNVRTLYLS